MAHILIAEQNKSTASYLYKTLKNAGNTVVMTERSLDAWKKSSSEYFDVLIVNIAMSGMDGFVLAQRALNENPDLQVIFITGFAAVAMDKVADFADMSTISSRPFHLGEIASRVRLLAGEGFMSIKMNRGEYNINNVVYADFSQNQPRQGANI